SDAATDKQYRAAFANMLRMLKKLYDNGVQIVAGTDLAYGFSLHRELELYAQAGIPTPEVLRIATIEAAQVMHMDRDFGSITPGKFADMILVNGNPAANISDIHKIEVVIKNGSTFKPAELYPEYGVR